MTDPTPHDPLPRVLARRDGDAPGPLLVLLCAIHGNEPAGVAAARHVLAALAGQSPDARGRPRRPVSLCGDVVALLGNRAAALAQARFIGGDLNRRWARVRVDRARAGALPIRDAEDAEQIALLGAFDAAAERARGPVVGLDLHTYSAPGAPFSVTTRDAPSVALARAIGWPIIASLERFIPGTVLELFRDDRRPIVGFEAGTHAGPDTQARHEAAIWAALAHLDMVDAADAPTAAPHPPGDDPLPGLVEVVHRHALATGDGFRMRPGFHNLAPVSAGQALADDRRGVIRAPRDGWVLMPLYQGQGQDGFFIAVGA